MNTNFEHAVVDVAHEAVDALQFIGKGINELGFGGPNGGGYGAIEGLSVAIAGTGLEYPIGKSIHEVAYKLDRIASALERIADAVTVMSE